MSLWGWYKGPPSSSIWISFMTDESYFRYWGKARKEDQTGEPYHLLPYHCLDVAAVGLTLLDSHPSLLDNLSELMLLPKCESRKWCIFLLGIHDLGKFARSFQMLREDLRTELYPEEAEKKQAYTVRHDNLGRIIWHDRHLGIKRRLFTDAPESIDDFVQDTLDFWLDPVFGHHGWPPGQPDQAKHHFTTQDAEAAYDFVSTWMTINQVDLSTAADMQANPEWREKQKKTSWLLAGIAVLCDWLGSDTENFKYRIDAMPLDRYWKERALSSAINALEKAGIIPSEPHPLRPVHELFPYIEKTTPLQQTCSEIELTGEPQLFILEDVTGAGKTEAALILTHHMMAQGQSRGIYLGLPTMATANAMYDRMAKVYRRLYVESASPSLILSHSARHLSNLFRQSLLDNQPEEQILPGQQTITAQCNHWLADSRKKALLAEVGIGTVDQALLGVIAVRHQSLRLFGLINKVLILDEVHAYDAYTNRLLHNLIQFHAAFGGSVILLSATLTQGQRQAFLNAFQSGRGSRQPSNTESAEYPLLTYSRGLNKPKELHLETRESVKRRVSVEFLHEESQIRQTIREAVEDGKCVCWIRNTVSDACDTWENLKEMDWLSSDRLHLFHSRFALGDRLAIEQHIIELFGKKSGKEQRRGQVLVATQVVEQSLDLDFDLMITDLAPIDLMIQRAGRLHRHPREDRGTPTLLIHSPPFTEKPSADWYKDKFPLADSVYSHTLILWRSMQILHDKREWRMPEDARTLLETVYDPDGEIPEGLSDNDLKTEGERYSERDLAREAALNLETGYQDHTKWNEEAHLKTRLGEDTHPVYLARWDGNELKPWVDEGEYPWDLSSLSIPPRQLSQIEEPEQTELKEALATLRQREYLFDNDSLIVPLIQMDDHWRQKGTRADGKSVVVIYLETRGFRLERGT